MIPSRRRFLLGAASVIAAGMANPNLVAAAEIVETPIVDIDMLRRAIAACVDRCLNPAWVIPDGATFSLEPGGLTDSRCYPLDNSAAWQTLDILYERYMDLMGARNAPVTATELDARWALTLRDVNIAD